MIQNTAQRRNFPSPLRPGCGAGHFCSPPTRLAHTTEPPARGGSLDAADGVTAGSIPACVMNSLRKEVPPLQSVGTHTSPAHDAGRRGDWSVRALFLCTKLGSIPGRRIHYPTQGRSLRSSVPARQMCGGAPVFSTYKAASGCPGAMCNGLRSRRSDAAVFGDCDE